MYRKYPKSYQLVFVVLLACLYLRSAWAQSEINPDIPTAEKPAELVYQSSFKITNVTPLQILKLVRRPMTP